MEAKDTVIKDLSLPILSHLDLPMGQAIAMEQAEISFKAGIKEVVEWVIQNYFIPSPTDKAGQEEWQAKLKEWGL